MVFPVPTTVAPSIPSILGNIAVPVDVPAQAESPTTPIKIAGRINLFFIIVKPSENPNKCNIIYTVPKLKEHLTLDGRYLSHPTPKNLIWNTF